MNASTIDILRIGIGNGLLWFPFVLGVGLLFAYFKEIDLSVDGIAVLSGIVTGLVWRNCESYLLSILAGVVTGILCSSMVCAVQSALRISGLMTGIIFSLSAHSISVLLVGESLVLTNTQLITGFGRIHWWQLLLVLLLIVTTFIFYNTRFGVAARKLGDGCTVNTIYPASLLRWSSYALSGCFYGLGGALYAHSQGLARSGGSFEFLLVSLTSYLCIARVADLGGKGIRRLSPNEGAISWGETHTARVLQQVAASPALKALLGAVFFETVLFYTIAVSPNPMLWKLIFAILLLLALASPDLKAWRLLSSSEQSRRPGQLSVRDLSVHYNIGRERRDVFCTASADFGTGLNLISGPNGTGKSTLLRTVAGAVAASQGQAYYEGADLLRIAKHSRPCFLLQQNALDTLAPDLTVAENLFAALNHAPALALGFDNRPVIAELLRRLNALHVAPIKEDADGFWNKPCMTLSGGEAHCVACYCALMSDAPVVLADEPTTGLDASNFARLTDILKAISSDRIVLLTSHDTRVAAIADRRFAVGGGKIELTRMERASV